jgi:hypothetical protein
MSNWIEIGAPLTDKWQPIAVNKQYINKPSAAINLLRKQAQTNVANEPYLEPNQWSGQIFP